MTASLQIENEDQFENALEAFSHTIERDLATRQLTFPTFLDLTIRIKRVSDDPNSSLEDIVRVIRPDALLSARIIRLANSVALNPNNATITGISDAVGRIGQVNVRSVALAVATEQLANECRSADTRLIASGLWMHTIDVAAWTAALTRYLRCGDPDTALFAGMLSTIGQFFLLARSSQYQVLEADLNRFGEFVSLWHEPVSRELLEALDVPDEVSHVFDENNPYGGGWPPSKLRDIYFVACLCAETPNPFLQFSPGLRTTLLQSATRDIEPVALEGLRQAAGATRGELLAVLRG